MGLASHYVEGAESVIVYTIFYLLMSIGIFSSALCFVSQERLIQLRLQSINSDSYWKLSSSAFSIYDFHNLRKRATVLAISISLIVFSMAGIPPLAGFCSKFYRRGTR